MNKKEPKQDWGFYGVAPRIVRVKYKELSHTEKWLYVCLKDLCGDKGSCFRSLRSLSQETDISIASLSKMIPNLHKSGLIHAEKKKRSKSGKEIWHITIVDIWQENAKYSRDCSKNEQNQEVVQKMNKKTTDCSENEQDCSENEQSPELDCSNFRYRRISMKNNIEERKNDNNSASENDSPSDTLASLSLENASLQARIDRLQQERAELQAKLSGNEPSPIATTTAQPPKQDDSLAAYSTEERQIHAWWNQLGLVAKVTPTNKAHWATLSAHVDSFEQMKSLYDCTRSLIESDTTIMNKTISPGNLANPKCLNAWKQKQEPVIVKPKEKEALTVGDMRFQRLSSMKRL